MYTAFFGLSEKPFTITPDPRYLYLSERHSEALAHLVFGIEESGGFIQLTGEVGTGKTTIVRTLLGELPDDVDVALILNPRLTVNEFLQTICEELKIKLAIGYPKIKPMIDALNAYLLEAHGRGRRTVLIVDEAQNLDPDVLEQVRLLTNLETTRQKLLQIILIGQTELQHTLARSDLRQLAQRITGRYHLEPLSRNETIGYIRHRMNIAGASRYVFTTSALKAVHRYSGGVPRLINVIADRALLGAYSKEQPTVSRSMVKAAAKEVGGIDMRARWLRVAVATAVAVGLASTAFWAGRELPLTAQSKDPEQTGLQATTVAIADPLSEPVLEQPFEQALETPIERFAEEPTEVEVPVEAVATLIANNAGTGTDNAFEMMFG
ncbi:MAG: AAA family ATPase, partial [Gammaproteobacteria bacterium]